jgi:hypothetical protein
MVRRMQEISPSSSVASTYQVWAPDDVVYGPVDLLTVLQWIREERIHPRTWIHVRPSQQWHLAAELSELQPHFQTATPASHPAGPTEASPADPLVPGLRPGTLRRVRIFADFSNQQLGRFVQFMEIVSVSMFRDICRQGDPGDAMYCVLEGEVRARILVDGKETTLTTLQAGDVFGEICLFDNGPRSADVVANADSTLLRITDTRFQELCERFPDLATPFLKALGRTLTQRIRADNKRLEQLISLSRAGMLEA